MTDTVTSQIIDLSPLIALYSVYDTYLERV